MKEQTDNEAIVQIDEHRLDKECVRLPHTYLAFAHQAAEHRRDVDEAKAELEVVEAELQKKIRATPEVYGLDKATDKSVEAAILMTKRYQEAARKLRDAKHRLDISQAVVSALEVKKKSLQLLVELKAMSYYSDPKISEEGRKAISKDRPMYKGIPRKRKDRDEEE